MKQSSRVVLILILISAVFGVALAVLKGSETGLRDAVGNMSAPWLLLPNFAGTLCQGWRRGAVQGTIACLAALLGFYVAEAFVLDLGGHPVVTNLALTLSAGRVYFAAGMVSGPVLGALGGVQTSLRHVVTASVIGVTLIGEPLAVFGWLASAGLSLASTGLVTDYPILWVGEMVIGFALCCGIAARGVRQQRVL